MPSPIIWVISDDPTIRKNMKTLLVHAGYQATIFMKSLDALECILMYPTQAPHLACLHSSSLEDGYEGCRLFKKVSVRIPIILFSPSPTHSVEIIKAQRAGVDRLLAIPTSYNISVVISTIATLLQPKDQS